MPSLHVFPSLLVTNSSPCSGHQASSECSQSGFSHFHLLPPQVERGRGCLFLALALLLVEILSHLLTLSISLRTDTAFSSCIRVPNDMMTASTLSCWQGVQGDVSGRCRVSFWKSSLREKQAVLYFLSFHLSPCCLECISVDRSYCNPWDPEATWMRAASWGDRTKMQRNWGSSLLHAEFFQAKEKKPRLGPYHGYFESSVCTRDSNLKVMCWTNSFLLYPKSIWISKTHVFYTMR